MRIMDSLLTNINKGISKMRNKCKITKNSEKTIIKALLFFIGALLLLLATYILGYYKEKGCFDGGVTYLVIINIFTALASIFGVSAVWEAFSKKSFAKEILDLANVSENYIKSGITTVYSDFTDIEWSKKFKYSKDVTIFFAYGSGWRSENRKLLNSLKLNNANITVILPNFDNDELMDILNRRFNYDKYAKSEEYKAKSIKEEINMAIKDFKKYNASIKLYDYDITTTYYLIDNVCIFAPFNHSEEKGHVPAIECEKGGEWFEFCEYDIKEILKSAKELQHD